MKRIWNGRLGLLKKRLNNKKRLEINIPSSFAKASEGHGNEKMLNIIEEIKHFFACVPKPYCVLRSLVVYLLSSLAKNGAK